MIKCPNCQSEILDGAVFCSDCGTQISYDDPSATAHIQADVDFDTVPSQVAIVNEDSDAWASLHLIDSGQILPLTERMEFTLGRISDEQPIMPDIDLTPYQAFAKGVSRLHAVLRKEKSRVVAMDLESSNGTYLNGERLRQNENYVLTHGDILVLGKLKVQILLRNP